MTATRATAELTDALADVLAHGCRWAALHVPGDADAHVRVQRGVVGGGRRTLVLFLRLGDLTPGQRARADAAFGRLGRRPAAVDVDRTRPVDVYFIDLAGRADIAAEAAVGLFRAVFDPPPNDYAVDCIRGDSRGLVTLPDDGRPRRPAVTT